MTVPSEASAKINSIFNNPSNDSIKTANTSPFLSGQTNRDGRQYSWHELELDEMLSSTTHLTGFDSTTLQRLIEMDDPEVHSLCRRAVHELNYERPQLGDELLELSKGLHIPQYHTGASRITFFVLRPLQNTIIPGQTDPLWKVRRTYDHHEAELDRLIDFHERCQLLAQKLHEGKAHLLKHLASEFESIQTNQTLCKVVNEVIERKSAPPITIDPRTIRATISYESYRPRVTYCASTIDGIPLTEEEIALAQARYDKYKNNAVELTISEREVRGLASIVHKVRDFNEIKESIDHDRSGSFGEVFRATRKSAQLLEYLLSSIRYRQILEEYDLPHCQAEAGPTFSVSDGSVLSLIAKSITSKTNVVPNSFSAEQPLALLAGANGGGKSTYLVMLGQHNVLAQVGYIHCASQVSYVPGSKIYTVFADRPQSVASGNSRHIAHAHDLRYIMDRLSSNDVFLIDEFFTGTEPQSATHLGKRVIDFLKQTGATGCVSTHLHELQTHYANDTRVKNLKVGSTSAEGGYNVDFTIRDGIAGTSYGVEMVDTILDVNAILESRNQVTRKD